MIFRIAVSNHYWSGSSVQGDQSLQTLSRRGTEFRLIHRAGFEPAPPKRMGLKSIALDHSANDALSFQFSLVGSLTYTTSKVFIKSEVF